MKTKINANPAGSLGKIATKIDIANSLVEKDLPAS